MGKIKTNFIFHCKYKDLLENMTLEQVGRVIFALSDYQLCGTVPKFASNDEKMAFNYIKKQIDQDNISYQKTCEKNKKAAEDRWLKEQLKKMQKNANAYECMQNVPSDATNADIDMDIDMDIDIGLKDIDLEKEVVGVAESENENDAAAIIDNKFLWY